MKSDRIAQIMILTGMFLLSVAGAPRPSAIHTAIFQSPLQPRDGASVVADKTVSQAQANWGDTLTYTITLTNTNVVSPLATLLTDTLPLSLAFQPASLTASEGAITHTANVITWSGVITPSGVVTLSLGAKVLQPSTTITNVAVFDAGDGPVASSEASTAIGQAQTYLPLVSRLPHGIYGRVTRNGIPFEEVTVELHLHNGGNNYSYVTNTSTASDGTYFFLPPALQPGQTYFVRYINSSASPNLYLWDTREIKAFQTTDSVFLDTFDIANIVLNAPAPGALVNLPANFQWSVRPATPTDSYEFNLTVPDNSQTPFFYTNPPLGYVGNYVLTHLPNGFQTRTPYIWFMWVYDGSGGYGISYWAYYVGFANAGSAQTNSLSGTRVPAAAVMPLLREQK